MTTIEQDRVRFDLGQPTEQVPSHLLRRLIASHAEHSAMTAIKHIVTAHENGDRDDYAKHLGVGDPVGDILGWLWKSGRRFELSLYVADMFSELRRSSQLQAIGYCPTLEDFLSHSLKVFMTGLWLTWAEAESAVAEIRGHAGELFSSDAGKIHERAW